MSLDLDGIKARVEAASEGPWEPGDVWLIAGCLKPDLCTFCDRSEPVRRAKEDINGTVMDAHWHRSLEPYGKNYKISGQFGVVVDDVSDPADLDFIVHARTDIPALLAIAEAAREYVTFPDRQPCPADPNGAHDWELEVEGRYMALRAAVLGGEA